MSLNFVMESIDGLHEEVQKLYTEKDGKFYLTGIEGVSPKAKVDEFRNNNIELTNRLKAFEGVDPQKYKEMETELADLRTKLEKSSVDEEQIEKLVANRVQKLQEEFATKEGKYKEDLSVRDRQLEELIIDGQVKSACMENKIRDSAVEDVVLRAKSVFKVKDGKAIGFKNGEIMYDATGTKELPITEWVKGLVTTAPHLFQESVTAGIFRTTGQFTGDPNTLSPVDKIKVGLK